MKTYYKIVLKKDNKFRAVHFGIGGSKDLPTNKWIKAQIKPVIDGSKGTQYMSGIHFLKSLQDAETYKAKFKKDNNMVIVPIHAKGIRKKEHSPNNVYLANQIKIIQ